MKQTRKAPYIFLLVLFIIVVFLVGINYGKQVEKANKAIQFVLSITPSVAATPLPIKPITFNTYKQLTCGVQFLYPDTLEVEKESTNEAVFSSKEDASSLQVICEKSNELISIINDPKIATAEVKFKTVTLKAREETEDSLTFQIRNPRNGKQIYVRIHKNLYPLFENTLQYLP